MSPTSTATSPFRGFAKEDFAVFEIEGLEPRMEALIATVRPKLHQLGDLVAEYLEGLCGEPMFPHVAKHARRTINPPHDTWVAYANNKRGYKAYPHFQIGLWSTHVFVQFAIIYECPGKSAFAERALTELDSVRRSVPAHYVWSKDHMVPAGIVHGDLPDAGLAELFDRLKTVKAAELTCGIHIQRDDTLRMDGDAFVRLAEDTFRTLMPLYKMAWA
ncbi:YktB family protein [Cohnella sp. GCM10027633]|uniref:YktB family protein n=1 Tax=unclassified Cohnella TaxID=2636738 RepID=UPI0036432638